MRLEQLAWLAANPRYTRRLVLAVGRRCRSATIKDVAQDMDLHWETVKDLDILYMKEQLLLAGLRILRPLALMKSPSDRDTAIASSFRISSANGPSGSAELIAPKHPWTSFMPV